MLRHWAACRQPLWLRDRVGTHSWGMQTSSLVNQFCIIMQTTRKKKIRLTNHATMLLATQTVCSTQANACNGPTMLLATQTVCSTQANACNGMHHWMQAKNQFLARIHRSEMCVGFIIYFKWWNFQFLFSLLSAISALKRSVQYLTINFHVQFSLKLSQTMCAQCNIILMKLQSLNHWRKQKRRKSFHWLIDFADWWYNLRYSRKCNRLIF